MEEVSGQGALKLSSQISLIVSPINSRIITLLMLVGVTLGAVSYRL